MRKVKETAQREIGRIKLSDTQELVATLVDNEKLDLRVFVDNKNYKGWTKQGLRFYLFDEIWEHSKELMEKVDKEYEDRKSLSEKVQ